MNDETEKSSTSVRRGRTSRVRLRKHQDLDTVRVEEAWSFRRPPAGNIATTGGGGATKGADASSQNNDKNNNIRVGEACYIAATVQNRRYYGVLVEQEALQTASILHWQNEALGLELNRRMRALQQAERQQQQQTTDRSTDNKQQSHPVGEKVTSNKTETILNHCDEQIPNKVNLQDMQMDGEIKDSNTDLLTPIPGTGEPKETSDIQARVDLFMDTPPTRAHAVTTDPGTTKMVVVSGNAAIKTTSTVPESILPSSRKRPRDNDTTDTAITLHNTTQQQQRQVQKLSYHAEGDYRNLIATYMNIEAAAEDSPERSDAIRKACQNGGGFVGKYYYQYEIPRRCLQISEAAAALNAIPPAGMNTTLDFGDFLQSNHWPPWFPLSNYAGAQQQQVLLDSLGLRRTDQRGNVASSTSAAAAAGATAATHAVPALPPMAEARSYYRVIILGAGIAGLSTALELFRETEKQGIALHIVILEARDRIGGRLWTDHETFSQPAEGGGSKPFPVDLGAGWIHGIQMNPLASLAKEAGVDFITTSEEVTMLDAGYSQIDADKDERAGKLFDQLLDLAVEDCWKASRKGPKEEAKAQAAVRWYGSILRPPTESDEDIPTTPIREPPAAHRVSGDTSVDQAIGKVIRDLKTTQMASMHDQERRMLLWNLKNVEYALGANVRDLSMRYWDIDERHAFEGDHVLLRQGYSTVVEYLVKELERRGERFELLLDTPVKRVEYFRKSASIPYFSAKITGSMIELSDTCKVITKSTERSEVYGDFVVSALPLGVLKESTVGSSTEGVDFDPPLPFVKQDAIRSVGFGLLNKVYLQFPTAFWRLPGIVDDDTAQFGNASSCNPHHYMFFDMGKIMAPDKQTTETTPAILMTLISGHEAVMCEQMDEPEVLGDVLATLRTIFQGTEVPEPISYQITKWGSDKYARGSYTYLPPGCTDQDFHVLQSPINGNGDSILLETSETFRVFFAGEHTTALHPSMAHGALLSGFRAAREIVSNMVHYLQSSTDVDRTIPLSIFRHQFPKAHLVCSLCGVPDSTVREGSLLAFKRGPRAILVHNNCVEYSPEVEVVEGVWKYVFQCCNRGKDIICTLCGKLGATIGCSMDGRCQRMYHFRCAEDTGFRFDTDSEGKEFVCDVHRRTSLLEKESRRISLEYFKQTNHDAKPLICSLCGISRSRNTGELLAFQQGRRRCLIHESCAKATSVVSLAEDSSSRLAHDYRNIFNAIDLSRECTRCTRPGATIDCSDENCQNCYHFGCAAGLNWNFDWKPRFRCPVHRQKRPGLAVKHEETHASSSDAPHDLFQHALFSHESVDMNESTPANHGVGAQSMSVDHVVVDEEASFTDEASEFSKEESFSSDPIRRPLSSMKGLLNDSRLVLVQRNSLHDHWNISFSLTKDKQRNLQYLSFAKDYEGDGVDVIDEGSVLVAINGTKVGTSSLKTLEDVLVMLKQENELMVEVQGSLPRPDQVTVTM